MYRNYIKIPHYVERTTQYGKTKNSLSQKNVSSNQPFINNNIALTKFLSKKCEREFAQFPQCATYVYIVVQKRYIHAEKI